MKNKFNKSSIVKNLLNNKYILYIVALICLFDILGYIMRYEFGAVVFFYLIGLLTYNYTKNMTVILGTSLIMTSLLHLVQYLMGIKEGMKENMEEDSKDSKDDVKKADIEEIMDELEYENKEEEEEEQDNEEETKEEFKEKKSKKSGYQNQMKLNPGMYNTPNKEDLKKQLGKASKMEKAYDNLDKMIGQEGIKSISSHTKNLVKQQNELMKQLKDITPTLNEAVGAISKIDLGKIGNMFNSLE